ncbi:hypothetical protein C5167_024638 [Papaver somniferum]|uniref:Phorbol-ester/DAG-type domain-containing protein n=1 Tax=Papaver somniferum TaxID=3469 RepID=A0A4Y7JSE2_PAPSO|nr:hypothetical protein C5167_024638 [Papaver somniferum]
MKIDKEISHPIHRHHKLKLDYTEIPFNCEGCKEAGIGPRYRCEKCDFDLHKNCAKCGFDLHPCCANLPQVLDDGKHNLYLSVKISSSCHRCGGKGSGWAYRSECKNYNLHVSCVKQMLLENWQAMYFKVDQNKVREIQTRIPYLKGNVKNYRNGGKSSKVKRYTQMAGNAVSIVGSVILGDPTAIIAAAVNGFISKA